MRGGPSSCVVLHLLRFYPFLSLSLLLSNFCFLLHRRIRRKIPGRLIWCKQACPHVLVLVFLGGGAVVKIHVQNHYTIVNLAGRGLCICCIFWEGRFGGERGSGLAGMGQGGNFAVLFLIPCIFGFCVCMLRCMHGGGEGGRSSASCVCGIWDPT